MCVNSIQSKLVFTHVNDEKYLENSDSYTSIHLYIRERQIDRETDKHTDSQLDLKRNHSVGLELEIIFITVVVVVDIVVTIVVCYFVRLVRYIDRPTDIQMVDTQINR